MKLSEAIRKGCEMVPKQCTGWFQQKTEENGNWQLTHACAIGAAAVAVMGHGSTQGQKGEKHNVDLQDVFPGIHNDDGSFNDIARDIMSKNDNGEMTREQIADWLDEEHGY